jgi:putative component of membrane protein insertase Oxa1/YidC/SpoIIIJ protein YidD
MTEDDLRKKYLTSLDHEIALLRSFVPKWRVSPEAWKQLRDDINNDRITLPDDKKLIEQLMYEGNRGMSIGIIENGAQHIEAGGEAPEMKNMTVNNVKAGDFAQVIGRGDWVFENGHSVEILEVFPNGTVSAIAPKTGHPTVFLMSELKPLVPRVVSFILTCDQHCCQLQDSHGAKNGIFERHYADLMVVVTRIAMDGWCLEHWKRFVNESGTNKLYFVKELRGHFTEVGLKEALDAVHRCEPFTNAGLAYAKFRDVAGY